MIDREKGNIIPPSMLPEGLDIELGCDSDLRWKFENSNIKFPPGDINTNLAEYARIRREIIILDDSTFPSPS